MLTKLVARVLLSAMLSHLGARVLLGSCYGIPLGCYASPVLCLGVARWLLWYYGWLIGVGMAFQVVAIVLLGGSSDIPGGC